jgi:hypothetical protein
VEIEKTDIEVEDMGISDHCTQTITFKEYVPRKIETQSSKRLFNEKQRNLFIQLMSETKWTSVINKKSVDNKYNEFYEIFTRKFNEAFPYTIKKSKIKRNRGRKPWYTKDMEEMAFHILELCAEQKCFPAPSMETILRESRRVYRKTLRDAKKKHNEKKIIRASNKGKASWELIEENCEKKKERRNQEIKFEIEGKLVESTEENANKLNEYFADVVKRRDNSKIDIQPTTSTKITEKTIFLSPIRAKEFLEIVDNVCKKMSAGYDEIPCAIIRSVAIYIVEPLTDIINESFSQGSFPTALKKSIVKPIYKKGEKTQMKNYRPISLQSGFSKILEKAMGNRMMSFLKCNNLIDECQHGFTAGKSTQTALAKFMHEVIISIEEKNDSVGIFYDYSKAFDSVNHAKLLAKLENYGIRGNALSWIRSYLKDRKQVVSIKDNTNKSCYSREITINIGVPQGGTIAPLLYLLFINDLKQNVPTGSLTVFADDTTQHVTSGLVNDKGNNDHFVSKCNIAVTQMNEYSRSNDLIINKDKTVYMQFHLPQRKLLSSPLILVDKFAIKEVEEIKYLGVHLNNTLTWNVHINKIAPQIASSCYLIKRLMEIATIKIAMIVYYSYIQSRLQYGIVLWGHSRETKRLFVMQKRALRYMAQASTNPTAEIYTKDSCKPLFRRFKILTLPGLYIYNTVMYKVNNFNKEDFEHKYVTRAKGHMKTSRVILRLTKQDPMYAGAKLFNALPTKIKNKRGTTTFANTLKEYLINECFYSVKEFCEQL